MNMHLLEFPFRCKIYGRRVLKWTTQRDLLFTITINICNTPKKHVLNYFALEMAAFVVAKGRQRTESAW